MIGLKYMYDVLYLYGKLCYDEIDFCGFCYTCITQYDDFNQKRISVFIRVVNVGMLVTMLASDHFHS